MKKVVFLLPLVVALTACGAPVQNPVSGSVPPTSSVTPGNQMANTATGNELAPPVVVPDTALTVESIDKIATLDDLKAVNPLLASLTGSNQPQFIELQKANMTMGILLTKLNSPEYAKLLNEQNEIYQGKSIWTDEVKVANEAFMKALKNLPTTPEEVEALKTAALKNTQALQKMQSSKAFQEYITANQAKLTQMSAEIKKLYTPEMLELELKIQKLSAEVQASQNPPVK